MIAGGIMYILSAAVLAAVVREGLGAGVSWPRALLGGLSWPAWPLLIAGSWLRYKLRRRSKCSSGS